MSHMLAAVPNWVPCLFAHVDGDAALIAVTWLAFIACWAADHTPPAGPSRTLEAPTVNLRPFRGRQP